MLEQWTNLTSRAYCHGPPYRLCMGIGERSGAVESWEWMGFSCIKSSAFVWGLADQPVGCAPRAGWRFQPTARASPPHMSSRHRTLEPYGRWHATISISMTHWLHPCQHEMSDKTQMDGLMDNMQKEPLPDNHSGRHPGADPGPRRARATSDPST